MAVSVIAGDARKTDHIFRPGGREQFFVVVAGHGGIALLCLAEQGILGGE
jgi:hypothetical protein